MYLSSTAGRSLGSHPASTTSPAGAARKALRNDPEARQGASINGLLPQWISPYTEWHTFSEEVYIMEGTIDTTYGRMTPGAYLAHPPEDVHGPMHSVDGLPVLRHSEGTDRQHLRSGGGLRAPILVTAGGRAVPDRSGEGLPG